MPKSPSQTKRASKKHPAPFCIECRTAENTHLVSGKEIYAKRRDLHRKAFWLCECGAYCGTHPGSTAALGYPAGALTRNARAEAHAAFDPLWQDKHFSSRRKAYAWLRAKMDLPSEDCHIGKMDYNQAMQVTELSRQHLARFQFN